VAEAKAGIGAWLDFYNAKRQHQSLGYRTPGANLPRGPVDMWTIGVADRLRFPRFPSELGKRGNARLRPHTHRRHGQQGFDIDEVRGKIAEPASAMTAIGADIETGGATP
jgi:hypothetical protein